MPPSKFIRLTLADGTKYFLNKDHIITINYNYEKNDKIVIFTTESRTYGSYILASNIENKKEADEYIEEVIAQLNAGYGYISSFKGFLLKKINRKISF